MSIGPDLVLVELKTSSIIRYINTLTQPPAIITSTDGRTHTLLIGDNYKAGP